MARRDQYQEQADPVKIGLLLDNPARHTDHAERIFEFVAEQYAASKRFERGFEFVKVYPWGPPAGFIQNTIDGFHQLCDQGVIAVIGGNHADDCIALPKHADKRKVPFMGMGATAQGMSEWAFSICWSSIPHDVYTVASWLKKNGHKNIVMTWDRADHALENILHFRNACARAGIQILADERFPQIVVPNREEIFGRAVERFKAIKPDALAHFGTGPMSSHWAGHVTRSGWNIPRVMNDAFHGATRPQMAEGFEGWVGTTMWDDDNMVGANFYDAYMERCADLPVPSHEMVGMYRDTVTAMIEGVILAPILTPDGVRRGLEMVQMVPAACGGPRTCIGFSPHAHRGLQGADVMVLRRMTGGKLVMEDRIEMF